MRNAITKEKYLLLELDSHSKIVEYLKREHQFYPTVVKKTLCEKCSIIVKLRGIGGFVLDKDKENKRYIIVLCCSEDNNETVLNLLHEVAHVHLNHEAAKESAGKRSVKEEEAENQAKTWFNEYHFNKNDPLGVKI